LTLVTDDGEVVLVFYPVFPPDRNASNVIDWLQAQVRYGSKADSAADQRNVRLVPIADIRKTISV
jgi:hypothetical protein